MSGPLGREVAALTRALTRRVDQECDRFEAAWKGGQRPCIEDHLAAVPEPERLALLRELILLEVDYRRLAGDLPRAEEFLARFPALDRDWIEGVLSGAALPATHLNSTEPGAAGASCRLGKFLLLKQVGQGGCGTVWRALDTELDRVVAIKIPAADLMTSPLLRARFRREARAAARLCHPNIVTLFDVDQVGNTPFLVMEYVEGIDLGRLVEQEGPLPVRHACDYVRQAAAGLQHAHECGLVHRDVKPANLLLTARGGVVKVLDLGLARLPRCPEDTASSLTEVGSVMGTADFIAPEQARDSHNVDARADVYSLGCSLYYLLTGRVPFPGGTGTEKMLRHLTEEPQPVEQFQSAVSPALAAVVRRMMARRPEDRPQTAGELVAALTAVLGVADEPASPPSLAPETITGAVTAIRPVPRPVSRRWSAVCLLLGLAALGLLLLLRPWDWFDRRGTSSPMPSEGPAVEERESSVTNSIGMKFVLIRPGRFLMGSPPSEHGRDPHEGPRREVVLTRPFYLGVHEVTQREFEAVMGYNPSHFTRERGGGPDHPVEMISYPVAVAFCERLTALPAEQRARRVYRLPTEAEWEYACRAGTTTAYAFGEDPGALGEHAWYAENADSRTHPVGKKKPNRWGLYDMYGNVWEWCADSFDPNYYHYAPSKDPHCTRQSVERVLRGGGWGEYGSAEWCRSATRGRRLPGQALNYHGLRVAFTAPGGAS